MVENIDLRKVLKGYSDKWIALSADSSKVVGVANSPKEALKQAHINKEENPILTRVPEKYDTLVL